MKKGKATLQLQTPATPEHAATVRHFLAESGRHFQVAEDSITDLEIAATEAFAMAAKATPGKATPTLSLEVQASSEDMAVSISATGGFDYEPGTGTDMPEISGPAIIGSLFPNARPDASGALVFRVPIGSR